MKLKPITFPLLFSLSLSLPTHVFAQGPDIATGINDVSPEPGALDVSPATDITLQYSLPVDYAYTDDRKLSIVDLATGIEVISSNPEANDPQSGSEQFILPLPAGTLAQGREYEVTLDRGFARINAAPWQTGEITSNTWRFSTAAASAAALPSPVDNIISVFPAPNSQYVPVDTDLIIEFPIDAYYAYTDNRFLTITDTTTNTVIYEVNPETGDNQEGSNQFVVDLPDGLLQANRQYDVQLDYGFATVNVTPWKTGVIASGLWQFSTGDPLSNTLTNSVDGIHRVVPAPGATNIATETPIEVYFTSDILYGNTEQRSLHIIDVDTAAVVYSVDPSTDHISQNTKKLSLDLPAGTLKENTHYAITLDYQFGFFNSPPWRTGALTNNEWTFTTGFNQPANLPTAIEGIEAVYPQPNSTDVAADTFIEVHFTARTSFASTQGSLLSVIDTRTNTVVASADPEYQDAQENKFAYRLVPTQPLEFGVTYSVQTDYAFARFNEVPWRSNVINSEWTFTIAGQLAEEAEDPAEDTGDGTSGGGNTDGGSDSGSDSDNSDGNDNTDGDNNNDGENNNDGDGENTDGDSGNTPTPPAQHISSTNGTILFVTQTPVAGVSFGTILNNFSNHEPTSIKTPRGGDLWIRYPDGTLRNLTDEAGFGADGEQGQGAIAVRSPSVHWDGTKAVFAMVTGSPEQYETTPYYWQLYEVTGLGIDETVSITKVPNQPADYNNVSPIYAASSSSNDSDEDIIFVSDITHGGRHLYPQYEEYDGAVTNTGLFRLNPNTADLKRLTHAPSGDFTPLIDGYGRLIFTRWDHLQRDQQNGSLIGGLERFGAAINYVDESVNAAIDTVNGAVDIFPEHLVQTDPDTGVPIVVNEETGHRFNQFFLWQSSPVDGSENEVLNHIGRQELGQSYTRGRFVDDPALTDITTSVLGGHSDNTVSILAPGGTFHPAEDPNTAGTFYMTHAQEFAFCGEILYLDGAPTVNPESLQIQKRTEYFDEATRDGCYRNPLPLQDGVLVAAYSHNDFGSLPELGGAFRLHFINDDGTPGAPLTNGISKNLSYWNPDIQISHTGELWELDPVEVRQRTKPSTTSSTTHASGESLGAPEQAACEAAYGNSSSDCANGLDSLRDYLADNKLALVISRNITSRDDSDTQQPYNLRVPNGVVSDSSQGADKLYDVSHLQFLQANLVRGYANRPTGRRPLAQYISDNIAEGLNNSTEGAIQVKPDGSVAAIVPAERALTWHLVDAAQNNKSIVSERYWVSFAAGEVRVCANCHGINDVDQMGNQEPSNPPQALTDLLIEWEAFQASLNVE